MRSCTSELSLARPVSAASRRDDTFREVHISVIAFKLVCDLPVIYYKLEMMCLMQEFHFSSLSDMSFLRR